MNWTFTEETEQLMHILQAVRIGEAHEEQVKALYVSKIVERPFQVIDHKVKSMLGLATTSIPSFDQMKLFIYDGHDT